MANEIEKRNEAFLIYQDENGIARVNVRFEGEDVWLNVEQMMKLFDASQAPERTHKKFLSVRQEGKRHALDWQSLLTKCLTPCEHVSDDSTSYSKQIPEGSVIFAKNGAASMSNKKRLTKIRCCIDMNTMAVFPKNDLILPDFLFATIEAMDVSSHVRQGAIPSISPKSIEDSYIAMPTKEEQYRYISMTKQADKSGFELRKSIDAIDAVIKSLINS